MLYGRSYLKHVYELAEAVEMACQLPSFRHVKPAGVSELLRPYGTKKFFSLCENGKKWAIVGQSYTSLRYNKEEQHGHFYGPDFLYRVNYQFGVSCIACEDVFFPLKEKFDTPSIVDAFFQRRGLSLEEVIGILEMKDYSAPVVNMDSYYDEAITFHPLLTRQILESAQIMATCPPCARRLYVFLSEDGSNYMDGISALIAKDLLNEATALIRAARKRKGVARAMV